MLKRVEGRTCDECSNECSGVLGIDYVQEEELAFCSLNCYDSFYLDWRKVPR
jgi:hypothetical protein